MQRLGAADEADRSHPVTPAFQGGRSRGLHLRVIGEAEVIIGAEVKDFAAILQPNARALSGVDETLLLKEAASADVA